MSTRDDASSAAAESGGSSWAWAAASSVACHVVFAVVVTMLPDGGRSGGAARDRLFTPGAVIPIETVESAAVARAEPVRDPIWPAPDSSAPESPAKAPVDHPKSSHPEPSSGSTPPPEPTEAHAEPSQAPGLSLHGLRDNARTAIGSAGKGVIDPSMLQGSRELYEGSIVPEEGGGVQGPAPAPTGKDYAFSKEKGKLIYRDPAGRFVATLNPDGRVNFRNKGAKATWTNIGMAGPGDILSAAAGEDPYARLKAALLKATFEMRLGMAIDFQKRQLDKRLSRLDSELDKIWADERRDLSSRKELLFQRWDECDEPEDTDAGAELPGFGPVENSELDDARQGAAASARKQILKFIREHAPKGSTEAFTAAELADMNRRRASKQKFNPYE
ncbi:MAG TPA: hypothetical protein VM869_35005 [Enhygromyxa sp.]|nr:hypothetical protein [Enhygromyxa sp.]